MSEAGQRRPYHVEAYPRLRLLDAIQQLRRGLDHLLWRDEHDGLVGLVRLSVVSSGQLEIDARFRGSTYLPHGWFIATIAHEVSRDANGCEQVTTICPGCRAARRVLVFANGLWRCRACQHLAYRGSVIGQRRRAAERLSQLDQAIGRGRPRYMRADLHRELRFERYLLTQEHQEVPATARPHQRALLSLSWMPTPPALLGSDGRVLGQA